MSVCFGLQIVSISDSVLGHDMPLRGERSKPRELVYFGPNLLDSLIREPRR
jgi:hypothetical protein